MEIEYSYLNSIIFILFWTVWTLVLLEINADYWILVLATVGLAIAVSLFLFLVIL